MRVVYTPGDQASNETPPYLNTEQPTRVPLAAPALRSAAPDFGGRRRSEQRIQREAKPGAASRWELGSRPAPGARVPRGGSGRDKRPCVPSASSQNHSHLLGCPSSPRSEATSRAPATKASRGMRGRGGDLCLQGKSADKHQTGETQQRASR